MVKTKGGDRPLKVPSTWSPKRYALRSHGPILNFRVLESDRKNKGKRNLITTMHETNKFGNNPPPPPPPPPSPPQPHCSSPPPPFSIPRNQKLPVRERIVADPFYDDPEYIPLLEHEGLRRSSLKFATAALSYLRQQGHDFELVMLDHYEGTIVGGGARYHHNFTAKRAGDPNAPTETFFSQVFNRRVNGLMKDLIIECCVSLGESDRLPNRRDNRGCVYCTKYIHHPAKKFRGLKMYSRNRKKR